MLVTEPLLVTLRGLRYEQRRPSDLFYASKMPAGVSEIDKDGVLDRVKVPFL